MYLEQKAAQLSRVTVEPAVAAEVKTLRAWESDPKEYISILFPPERLMGTYSIQQNCIPPQLLVSEGPNQKLR